MDKKLEKNPVKPVMGREEKALANRHNLYVMNAFLNKYFGFLIIILVATAFYFSFSLLIKPKYQSILTKINDNASIQNQVFPKYKELSASRKLNDVYAQIKPEDIARVKALIPKETGRQELFAEIVYLLQKQGVKVSDLQISKDGEAPVSADKTPAKTKLSATTATATKKSPTNSNISLPSGVGRYDISLEIANADYTTLKKAVFALENSLRLIDVRDLDFNPKAASATLQLTTYYVKDALSGEAPVPLDGPASELNLP